MVDILSGYQSEFDHTVTFLKTDVMSLRTGRAHPSLLDSVMVEAYGTRQPIVAVGSISIPDARTLIVEPWDKSLIKEIEKGIIDSKLGLNPAVQGTLIRIPLPVLTEESRKNLVKVLNEKLEHARISIRNIRDKAKTEVVAAEKGGDITEDEKYRMLEQLDKTAAGFNEKIKHVGEEKETEIMTI